MAKISKIIIITLLIGTCLISFTNVHAIDNPEAYRPSGDGGFEQFTSKAGVVLGALRSIGAVVSVLGIAILGIRYMLGSVEQKANYKETALPFVIGIVILVTITAIVTLIQDVAKD